MSRRHRQLRSAIAAAAAAAAGLLTRSMVKAVNAPKADPGRALVVVTGNGHRLLRLT
jgi:hypothetical protein